MELKLNTSFRVHISIGIFTGLWLAIFLILIAPFDVSDLDLMQRLELMPMYGVISSLGYILLIPLQNVLYLRRLKWSFTYEVLFLTVYNVLVLTGSFLYYSSPYVNGDFPIWDFVFTIYYPIFFLVLTIMLILRWLVFKNRNEIIEIATTNPKIILTGDNKLDALQIDADNLVAIKSADNYVEVMYLTNGVIAKKLLRNTLKNMERQNKQLLKVHRSYLINPIHFTRWKDGNTIVIGEIEVPVTKSYKKSVLALKIHP